MSRGCRLIMLPPYGYLDDAPEYRRDSAGRRSWRRPRREPTLTCARAGNELVRAGLFVYLLLVVRGAASDA